MNAKKLKQANQNIAYTVLNELLNCHLWDPVITNRMTAIQCQNRFYKAIDEYFKNHANLIYWNRNSSVNILVENSEIVPMMQEYNFHKFKEENNL